MGRPVRTAKQTTLTKPASQFQYLILLIVLSILNISFFLGFGNYSTRLQCSTDTIVEVITLYIANNGQTTLSSLIPPHCSGTMEQMERQLKSTVIDLIGACRKIHEEEVIPKKRIKPLVTLVTTFADHIHSDSEKISVHNNTLFNWAKFKPLVNLVLFSNDTFWAKIAKSAGWDILKPEDEINGKRPPVLKSMLLSAMNLHETAWYGYINADILLTSDLITNIDTISKKYNTSNSRIMLTGRRTNVANFSSLNPTSDESIRYNADKYGTLYKEDAEDFFITTKNFPWKDILPLVVGRPAYDNWLVAEARCRLNTTVIDVTETFLAFHQTTLKGGNSEGHFHHDSDYNINVIKQRNIVPNFLAGLTDCILFNTFKTFCGTIGVKTRTNFGPACKCNGTK